MCCESTKLLWCCKTGSGCRCRTNSQNRLTQSRRTGRISAGSETGKALSKLRRRGTEVLLTAAISYLVGLITASRFKDAESRFLLTQTTITAAMLPQRCGSSANCGVRRDCLRYPNHDGFKGKRRCRFLMSRCDVSDAAGVCLPSSAQRRSLRAQNHAQSRSVLAYCQF